MEEAYKRANGRTAIIPAFICYLGLLHSDHVYIKTFLFSSSCLFSCSFYLFYMVFYMVYTCILYACLYNPSRCTVTNYSMRSRYTKKENKKETKAIEKDDNNVSTFSFSLTPGIMHSYLATFRN